MTNAARPTRNHRHPRHHRRRWKCHHCGRIVDRRTSACEVCQARREGVGVPSRFTDDPWGEGQPRPRQNESGHGG